MSITNSNQPSIANGGTAIDLIGTGFAFPPALGPSGTMAMVTGTAEIEQAIWMILATAPGERPMRPEFGCGIHELLFSPVDATTAALVEREVREALMRWEPRIDVIDVRTRVDPVRDGAIEVQLVYAVKDTHDPRSLVFPFYVIPPE